MAEEPRDAAWRRLDASGIGLRFRIPARSRPPTHRVRWDPVLRAPAISRATTCWRRESVWRFRAPRTTT